MDKQKQIEEMVKELAKDMGIAFQLANTTRFGVIAADLIGIGYRKIPEGAVVLTEEEYKTLLDSGGWHEGDCIGRTEAEKGIPALKKYIRKETAEKFAERLKGLLEEREYKAGCSAHMMWTETAKKCVDEICKEITEGKV